jgi:hypothetical protein
MVELGPTHRGLSLLEVHPQYSALENTEDALIGVKTSMCNSNILVKNDGDINLILKIILIDIDYHYYFINSCSISHTIIKKTN